MAKTIKITSSQLDDLVSFGETIIDGTSIVLEEDCIDEELESIYEGSVLGISGILPDGRTYLQLLEEEELDLRKDFLELT